MAIVTESKRIKLVRCFRENPVFISWLNTLGGREHWLFSVKQDRTLIVSDKKEFEQTTNDLENSRGQISTQHLFAQPQLTVGAWISNKNMKGIETLLYSTNIEILVNPDTWNTTTIPPKWVMVRVIPGTYRILSTNETHSEISITFDLNYINTQRQ